MRVMRTWNYLFHVFLSTSPFRERTPPFAVLILYIKLGQILFHKILLCPLHESWFMRSNRPSHSCHSLVLLYSEFSRIKKILVIFLLTQAVWVCSTTNSSMPCRVGLNFGFSKHLRLSFWNSQAWSAFRISLSCWRTKMQMACKEQQRKK